jgi:Flp pilus assembly secretin CpaC
MKSIKSIPFIVALISLVFSSQAAGQNGLNYIETASGSKSKSNRELVQWTHSRLSFNKELERVAVGQDSILQVEILDSQEVLVLSKSVGRTSLMVWYTDNSSETFLFSVVEDLSVLRSVIRDIHKGISITLAPDRAALILRGKVPTIEYRKAAETAARDYLSAGTTVSESSVVVGAMNDELQKLVGNQFQLQSQASDIQPMSGNAAIINLIQVEQLPQSMPDKIKQAIDVVGGENVMVKRLQKGDLPNDLYDTFLLSGEVETQVELVRVLNLASKILDSDQRREGIKSSIGALANESGGLIAGIDDLGGLSRGTLSGSIGGNELQQNNLESNIARATLLSAASGRIVSTIQVRDLPQVRVAVQMYEVNRQRLQQWRPDYSLVTSGYDADSGLFGLDGKGSKSNSGVIENALQVLGGALVNNLQVGTSQFAFDLLFSALEKEGISRTLSRPNLTVLAGETAVFRAGGEVPVPTAFASSGLSQDDQVGPNTSGVFSGTDFKAFGVQLAVRAMVDDKDNITLDLSPTISMPDTLLTQSIAGSTGNALNTAAFNVRSINTSTRLKDGEPLIIGGLVTRDNSQSRDFVPGLDQLPVINKLSESTGDSALEKELIIIVTPTLIREARHDVGQWVFPSTTSLINDVLKIPTYN